MVVNALDSMRTWFRGTPRAPADAAPLLSTPQAPPHLPIEVWAQVTPYLELRDLRAMAVATPLFRQVAAAPHIQQRFVDRTNVLDALAPSYDSSKEDRHMYCILGAFLATFFLMVGGTITSEAKLSSTEGNQSGLPHALAASCLAPQRMGLNTTAPWTQAHPTGCTIAAFAYYSGLVAGTLTGGLSSLALATFVAIYLPGYLSDVKYGPAASWHQALRRLYDEPVDRVMDTWRMREIKFAQRFARHLRIYDPFSAGRPEALLNHPSADWSTADQIKMLAYGFMSPAAGQFQDEATRSRLFQKLLQTCIAPRHIDYAAHTLNVDTDPKRMADAVRFAASQGHLPTAPVVLAWVARNWVDAVAAFVSPLVHKNDDDDSTIYGDDDPGSNQDGAPEHNAVALAWRHSAETFLDSMVISAPQTSEPLMSYAASFCEHGKMLHVLSDAGANPEAFGPFGTALHRALKLGHVENAQALCQMGVSQMTRDPDGNSADQLALSTLGLA